MSRSIHVMLVEDNPADAKLTSRVLSRCEHLGPDAISVLTDGEQALTFLRERASTPGALPQLVLLDLNIPRIDGLSVLEAMRADPALATTPVIILSSSLAPRDVERAYALGANAYIRKPVDLVGLQALAKSLDGFWFHSCRFPEVER